MPSRRTGRYFGPVVLTPGEVARLLAELRGIPLLMASLLYGAGLRLLECARLRIKDVDFERREIRVHDGKGRKDRLVPLPIALASSLRHHVRQVEQQHLEDLTRGAGYVELPGALHEKLPNAPREWLWQWLFPATRKYLDPKTKETRRHHLHETVVQRAVRQAAQTARLTKRVSCHTCATPSPPTSSNPATTSAPSKSSLATATSPPP